MRVRSKVYGARICAACVVGFCWLAVAAAAGGQALQYVPAISTYAGGATASCSTATDSYGDGCPATQAVLSEPWATVSDTQGNVYLADLGNNIIRRIDARTGVITLVAGGATSVCSAATDTVGDGCPATQATLNKPQGLRFDLSGNLLIADGGNDRIRSVNLTTGIITTIAGNGSASTTPPGNASPAAATATKIDDPYGIALDSNGNLYIGCALQSAVLMVQAINGQLVPGKSLIYTIAGTGTRGYTGDGGPGTQAELDVNRGVYVGPDGSIYVADYSNFVVRKITSPFQNGVLNIPGAIISTIAGTGTSGDSGDGGQATLATLGSPTDVFLGNPNELYIVTYLSKTSTAPGYDYVREVNLGTGVISTLTGQGTRAVAGDGGPAALASISGPQGGNYDRFGNIFVTGYVGEDLRLVSRDNYFLQAQGVGATSASQNVIVQATSPTTLNGAVIAPSTGSEFVLGAPSGCSVGGALAQSAYCTLPVSFQPAYPGLRTARLVATDGASATNTLGLWGTGVAPMPTFGSSTIATIAGTGTAGDGGDGGVATAAQVSTPSAGVVDSQGNIYFADTGNNVIRRIDAQTGNISTVAGNATSGYAGDGRAATAAQLNAPSSVAVDAAGNLYISDSGNNVIRFVSVDTGLISTIAGTGTAGYTGDGGVASAAELNNPQGLLVDAGGNIYVADAGNNVIRRFAQGGPIVTFAGTGQAGDTGDGGPASLAEFSDPTSLAFDLDANLYVADTGNGVVREVSYTGQVSTVAGTAGSSSGNTGDGGAATAASLSSPASVAVDAGGDLFIGSGAEVRMVNSAGVISTVAGTGASGSYSGEGGASTSAVLDSSTVHVMLDSAANLYIADTAANRLLEVTSSKLRSIDFGLQAAGTTGFAAVVPVQNAGNSTLTLSGITVSSNFVLDTSSPSDCTATTTLAPGTGCVLSITFSPANTVHGSVTGTVVLTDNALNATSASQTLQLAGSTNVVAATTTTVTVSPAAPFYGASATAMATITGGSSPTGTVAFTVNGTSIGTANVASGAASIALPILPAGAASVSATYSGDTGNKSSTGSLNVTVQPAVLMVTATNASMIQTTAVPSFTYTITGFVNGDTSSVVSGAPSETTSATSSSAAGAYPITVGLGTLAAANYTFTFVNGTLTVTPPPPPDFSISASPSPLTITDGQVGTETVSMTSLWGYTGTVTWTCSNLPKNVTCVFTSPTLTADPNAPGATVQTQLTIGTDSLQHIAENRVDRSGSKAALAIALCGPLCLFLFGRRRRPIAKLLAIFLLGIVATGATSCSNVGTAVAPIGTSQITVTATDNSTKTAHTTNVTLVIQ